MRDVTVTIHLPEALAKEAEAFGLLSSEQIATLLRAEIAAQLQVMAHDPHLQAELRAIEAEFSVTEGDGLDEL